MGEKERFEIILEDLNRKMDLLIEGHRTLDQKIDRIADGLRQEMHQMRGELQAEIIGVRDGLKEEVHKTREELTEEIKKREEGLKKEISKTRRELGEKIDKISEKLLDHERRIKALENTTP
ncbi:MAG TPA: hypothetical protein ENL39_04770 [Candidatus Aerophobetes bacterium]|uniref:DUF1640 domain-containing protein n=1 Tax=Aerophobetes bacterium TaxID=2030807 RepID=A0A7V5HZG9_UNCAE|nr:hypothetical protein [Candidatus Aerophobetes bacterium]